MRRPVAPLVAAGAVALALGLLIPSVALGQGAGRWFKFLFTPQAGGDSTCLSCGWHDACVYPYAWGTALDFPAYCSDTDDDVYFRAFGLEPWGSEEYVAFGTPFTRLNTVCKETYVRIRDKDTYDTLGYMRYTHTYKTRSADMLMYVSESGRPNQYVFAAMAKDPSPDPPATPPPPEQAENEGCITAGYWTGVHLHEYQENGSNNIFLRDGGDCTAGDRYPCAPAGGGPYDPQDWGADWARIFCIDDTDCDGWTDDEEDFIGTDPWDSCPDNPSDDAWPPDINRDTACDVSDVLQFPGHLNTICGEGAYWRRLDLDATCAVDVSDVLKLVPYMNTSCQ